MYCNNKDLLSKKHVSKGQIGEDIFEIYCRENNLNFRIATPLEDYRSKIDFFLNGFSVAVKNNYNSTYKSVVIEYCQLSIGCPSAWIDHDIDFIAFIIGKSIKLVPRKALHNMVRKLVINNSLTLKNRKQWDSKGEYIIAFLPVRYLDQIAL